MTDGDRSDTQASSGDAEKALREAVKQACLKAARNAYEDALMRGLCAEGALEAALGAIETLDLDSLALQRHRR
ncbi:MAG TPA: acetyltransferase [Gammaproteobacteria bacterium]